MRVLLSLLVLLLLVLGPTAFAQPVEAAADSPTVEEGSAPAVDEGNLEPAVSVSAGVTLTSRFIYRGINLGEAPQIQPRATLNAGGFEAALWSSCPTSAPADGSVDTPLDANYREVNVWLLYAIDVGVGTLTPYVQNHFNPNNGQLFDFDDGEGAHFFQAQLSFAGDERSVPIDVMVGYVFYNDPGQSVYLEGGYSFDVGDLAMRAFVGGVPDQSPFNGVTDDGPQITNIGLTAARGVRITDGFTLPLGVGFIVNPYTEDAFATVSVSL